MHSKAAEEGLEDAAAQLAYRSYWSKNMLNARKYLLFPNYMPADLAHA